MEAKLTRLTQKMRYNCA